MLYFEFASLNDVEVIELCRTKLQTNIEPWERSIYTFISEWLNPSITSIQVFTSGSTGSPKAIWHPKKAMIRSAELTCKTLSLQKGDVALLCLPANKIAGMMMIVRCMIAQMNLCALRPSAQPLQQLTDSTNIHFAAFTPMQISGIRNDENCRKKLESIHKVILGGEDLQIDLLQIIQRLPNQVYATFGMTETISHIALKRLNGKKSEQYFNTLHGITVASDKRGCLEIYAPMLSHATIITNDMVKIISDTQFKWLGRIDHVINTGGVKLQAEEIESQLQDVIPFPYFIYPMPNELTGEKPVLCIETETLSDLQKLQISEAITRLKKIQQPKSILLFKQFIRTDNGKIKRHETFQQPHVTW